MLSQNLSAIESQCEQFFQNILDLATFYLAAGASAKLIANTELPSGYALEMRMSDDYPSVATTIRQGDDVLALYHRGEYERLNAYQATVALCSLFEVFTARLGETLGVRARRSVSIVSSRRSGGPVEIRNQTLCLVRSIHEAFDIDSQLNKDEALCWIYNFFLLRNIVVHEGGILDAQKRSRLVARWARHPLDQHLEISGNHIDDMVHYLRSHVRAFLYQSRRKCGFT